jgi:hypothetical protein
MSKITYLLGAGASCNALPLVNNFKDRLKNFNDRLAEKIDYGLHVENKNYASTEYLLPPKGKYAKILVESIAWLRNIAEKHASIDTYAKKLFIKSDNEALKDLHKLKSTLSCYLLLEQSLEMTDKRYDNFFASILIRDARGIPKLPKDVNIITWNYDTQLEKSYEGFCTIPEIVFEEFTRSKNIIRLNGSCSYQYKIETRFLGYTEFSISFLESVIQLYDKFMNIPVPIVRPDISFAWEKSDIEDKIIETLKGTTTLVIIGYSLPYFNREIDKMIIHAMHPTLVKIFIQVQEKEYESHKERYLTFYDDISMKKFIEDKIKMVPGTDLFYMPDDMPR